MMSTSAMTLADITAAESAALAAATKATQAAEAAQQRADAARQRADDERVAANREYLAMLTSEHPAARLAAVEKQAAARHDLDQSVRGDGDIFCSYLDWVTASIQSWEIDESLARMRRFHGIDMRESPPPTFSFGIDVGAVIDQIALELEDEAISRIDARRASFLAGRKES
jgi:hypothetical protein